LKNDCYFARRNEQRERLILLNFAMSDFARVFPHTLLALDRDRLDLDKLDPRGLETWA
jgi:hypothetical protein